MSLSNLPVKAKTLLQDAYKTPSGVLTVRGIGTREISIAIDAQEQRFMGRERLEYLAALDYLQEHGYVQVLKDPWDVASFGGNFDYELTLKGWEMGDSLK